VNYAAHIEWAAKRKGLPVKMPEKADVGYRSPHTPRRLRDRMPLAVCGKPRMPAWVRCRTDAVHGST